MLKRQRERGRGSRCSTVGPTTVYALMRGCGLVKAVSAVGRRPLTTTEDQSATFIELFFDLVFVYAVTQTVSLVHEDLSWTGLGSAVVVFWLVWWAWTQYTWALNSADTAHPPSMR